jgi:hypothetical protein
MVTNLPYIGQFCGRAARKLSPSHLASFALLCLTLSLSGCGATAFKPSVVVAGGLTASSSTVAFGSVPVGHSSNNYVKVVNQGSSPVTISQLHVSGQAFSSSAQDSVPVKVDAQGSFNLSVQFNPTSAGEASGQLTITNSSTNEPLTVSLTGTGTAAEAAALGSITCASSAVTGSAADSCTVTLTAVASNDVTVNLKSDNSAVSLPSAVAIRAGSIRADFTATVSAVGSVQSAILTASALGASQTFTMQLGAVAASIDLSTTSLSFGDVPVDSASMQTLTISSTGNAPVTITSISITGHGFSISGGTLPLTLNPNQTANLGVQFDSSIAGNADGQLTLTTNSISGSTKLVKLHANAIPQLKQFSCAANSVSSGATNACTVALNSAAPSGGQAVALASNNGAVSIPASVLVPAGATSAAFDAIVSVVSSTQAATLTASSGGISKKLSLQLGASVSTFTVSASSLAFGSVTINGSATQSLALSSTGTAAVTVSAASIAGTGFSISGVGFPLTLNPGQTANLTVQFTPTFAGTATGQITLTSNSSSGTSSVVSLSGTGVPALAGLICANGSMSAAGTDTCTVSLNAAAGTGGFAVSLASGNSAVTVPASATVPAGSTTASFAATVSSVTTTQTATLTASAGSITKAFTIQLGGTVPTLTISAATVTFGNVAVNSAAMQSLTLSSTGSAAVTVSGAALTGTGFSISGASFPITLNPGQTVSLAVQFNPTVAGAVTGKLTLTSNSSTGTSAIINLSGTGTPVLTGLTCSSSSITGAGTDSCTITLNVAATTGGFAVNLASNNSAVAVPVSMTVPAGSRTAGFTATISPVATAQSATLTAGAGGVSQSFSLQLNLGTATLGINAASIAFGNVNLNTPTTQSITLTSTGSAAVTISSFSVTGAGFTVSGATLPLTLNPGQSAVLNIVFSPAISGAVSGQLTIASNSSSGSPVLVSLTGSGVSYQVNLSWSAPNSSSDPVAGYNVYRAAAGSTNYQQLNNSMVTQTAYSDSTILSGRSYDYIVASVDAAGFTSTASNTFSAIIP